VNFGRRRDASIIGASSALAAVFGRAIAPVADACQAASKSGCFAAMAPLTSRAEVCARCDEEVVLGYARPLGAEYICRDCEERAILRASRRRGALLSVVIAVALLLTLAGAASLGLRPEGPPTRDPVAPGR
jgi:hypothetical protein